MIYNNVSNSIIVIGSKFSVQQFKELGTDNTVIIPSDNKELIQIMTDKKVDAVTYGFSDKSTVTFSSISEETAVISVQRSIKTADNKIIEPLDMPVVNKNIDENLLLYMTALKIILN